MLLCLLLLYYIAILLLKYVIVPHGACSVWDLASGAVKLTLEGHTAWVKSVAISPDGAAIISGSKDKTVR